MILPMATTPRTSTLADPLTLPGGAVLPNGTTGAAEAASRQAS